MSSIERWDRVNSIIYDTFHHRWEPRQVREWLKDFMRIPGEYVEKILLKFSTGASIAAVSRIELHSCGLPWGLCSHIAKGQEQLANNIVFKPIFIDAAKPYPWPCNGNLTLANTALIIIDMQKDFCGNEGYAAKMYPLAVQLLREPIEPIKELLSFARESGLTIIHTREGHHTNLTDCPWNKRWRSEGVRAGIGNPASGSTLVIGSDQHDIIDELYPAPGEDVIDKPGKGSFYATNLELLLKNSMIDNLLITGVTTDVCVHTTLRDANDRGFECLLIEDACAAVDPTNHAAAISMVHKSGGIFGATCTTQEALAVLRTLVKS
jgi:nicotinamidase-related amidase